MLYLGLTVVLTAVAISTVSFVLGSRDARDRVVGQLRSVATLKQQEIATWQGNLDLNLDIVLSSPTIATDLRTLAESPTPDTAQARQEPTGGLSSCSSGPPSGWACSRSSSSWTPRGTSSSPHR